MRAGQLLSLLRDIYRMQRQTITGLLCEHVAQSRRQALNAAALFSCCATRVAAPAVIPRIQIGMTPAAGRGRPRRNACRFS